MTMLAFLLLFAASLGQNLETVDPKALEWFRKGEDLIGTSREYSEEQAEYFQKAVELAPGFAAARYNLALIYIKQRKHNLALEELNALIDLEPQDSRGYFLRARLRLEVKQLDQALEDFGRVLQMDPKNYDAWQLLGGLYYQQERYQESAQAFQKILELSPNPVEAYFDLALSQQALGQKEKAIKNYRKFLVHYPDDFQAHFFLGLLYREVGQDDLALEHFLKAEEEDPAHRELAQELGNLYLDRNNLEEAHKSLLQANLDSAINLGNLGVIAQRRGEYSQAENYFRRALEKEPNSLLWAHLGDLLAEQKRNQEAAKAYENALGYDPQDLDTLYNLGNFYANLDRRQDAIDLLRRALQIKPHHPGVHYSLAVIMDQGKDFDQAQLYYLKAIEYGADEAYAHFRLAFFFARQAETAKALEHLEMAFEKEPQKYVQLVLDELRKVYSDLDSIRYSREFNDLLSKYRGRLKGARS
ncbi:tetratricopeptide repeat protein, partial [Acidobacteria bacterium AH-259-O06]|nr:tetratricopeptide repeat protein [Acidobacteria bacterium AH-259-O06]